MQFNSYIFIMAFLPIIIVSYYTFNKIKPVYGKIVLIIGSALFYIYGSWEATAILGISIFANYGMAVIICHLPKKKILLGINVIFNVGILLYFKYCNFFIANINTCLSEEIPMQEIILPLGISFFTFQQIMYVVNIYKEEMSLNLLDYLAYILYFHHFTTFISKDSVSSIDVSRPQQ